MKTEKVIDLIETRGITIPNSLIKFYKKLGLNEKELIFLAFLMGRGEKIIFDVEYFCKETTFDLTEIMTLVSSLTEKKLLNMIVDKGKEYLDIKDLYLKLTSFIIAEEDNENISESNISNIYEVIEKEFGRTLSPIEYETIKGWIDANISEEMIREALKEAVLNGVNNLKYIDKILYEWSKKGYKKPSDIKRKKLETKDDQIDLFDYDWLEDNE